MYGVYRYYPPHYRARRGLIVLGVASVGGVGTISEAASAADAVSASATMDAAVAETAALADTVTAVVAAAPNPEPAGPTLATNSAAIPPPNTRKFLVELTAAIDAAGTLQTFYVGTYDFQTSSADTPANTAFRTRLQDPGSLGVTAYGQSRTSGSTVLDTGRIVIVNPDGELDGWLNYGFDGRAVSIRSGTTGAYPADFPLVLTGTVEGLDVDFAKITIRLRDRQFLFELPAQSTRFAGSNALPAGLEGVATDLKGQVKPKAFGQVFIITPPLVNTSKLTYQVSDGAVQAISAVYDSGVALTPGADFATSVLLQAAAPGAGTFVTCLAEGYYRLGTTPAGEITADVTQGAASGNRTVAQILKALALLAGVSSGDISAADVTALDTANSSVVGVWVGDESTFQAVMDAVAASAGAYYGFDALGVLRMGLLSEPAATPLVTITDPLAGDLARRPARDNGVPVWKVVVRYKKNWTTQSSGLAGAVTAVRRSELAQDFLTATAEDATVKTQFLMAGVMEVETLLTTEAAALAEAARLLALHKVRRDIWEVPVPIDVLTTNSLGMMSTVALQIDRFGLDAGQNFRVVGVRLDLVRNRAVLSLWG